MRNRSAEFFLLSAGGIALAIVMLILMIAFWQWATQPSLSSPAPTIKTQAMFHACNKGDSNGKTCIHAEDH